METSVTFQKVNDLFCVLTCLVMNDNGETAHIGFI